MSVAVPECLKHENRGEIQETSGFIFKEEIFPSLGMEMELKAITYNTQSDFQRIEVIETVAFGKTLVLDGKTQSTLRDEFVYHECLVHPPMLAFGWASGDMDLKPKRVYIGGGGELATAREVLKHPSVEEVVMVDLDKMVVDVSREQLHEWSTGCFSDPRLTVHYTDAHAWLNRSDADTGLFDLIIMDIADPFEAGPGIALYTQEFYRIAKSKLTPGGVFVTQSGPGGLLTHTECFTSVHRTLQSVFEHVLPYTAEIPSFGSNWGWNLAFDASGVRNSRLSSSEALEAGSTFKDLSMTSVSTRLKSRVDPGGLRFYDGEGHRGIFHISKPIRDSIALEERIITKDNPVFML